MKNAKTYFCSHLRASLRPLLYLLVSVCVLTLVIGLRMQPIGVYTASEFVATDYRSTLYSPVIFLYILVLVLPAMEFSFFKRRISLDCAYALPITRRAMGTVHYLTGLIQLLCTFSASYLVNFFLLLSRGAAWFRFTPMLAHYGLCLLLGAALYSVMVFIFNAANTTGDGIWFMLLYTVVLALVTGAVQTVTDGRDTFVLFSDVSLGAIPWMPLSMLTTYCQRLVELEPVSKAFWQNTPYVVWLFVWVVLGIAATVAFLLTFGKRRPERTEELSTSFLGYRVLIPTLAVSGMLVFHASDFILFWVIIELLALLGYTVYRRGFHYRRTDLAVLCLLALFLLF